MCYWQGMVIRESFAVPCSVTLRFHFYLLFHFLIVFLNLCSFLWNILRSSDVEHIFCLYLIVYEEVELCGHPSKYIGHAADQAKGFTGGLHSPQRRVSVHACVSGYSSTSKLVV